MINLSCANLKPAHTNPGNALGLPYGSPNEPRNPPTLRRTESSLSSSSYAAARVWAWAKAYHGLEGIDWLRASCACPKRHHEPF